MDGAKSKLIDDSTKMAAKKKKVLTDNDYEELNKMMAEYEASPTSAKVRFAHDDGSIWYEGMRGGHGDRDFANIKIAAPSKMMLLFF